MALIIGKLPEPLASIPVREDQVVEIVRHVFVLKDHHVFSPVKVKFVRGVMSGSKPLITWRLGSDGCVERDFIVSGVEDFFTALALLALLRCDFRLLLLFSEVFASLGQHGFDKRVLVRTEDNRRLSIAVDTHESDRERPRIDNHHLLRAGGC